MKSPDYPITNSTLKRRAPLPRGSGLRQSGPLKTRKVSKRFAKRRNPDYRAFIRTFPCCLLYRDGEACSGGVECAHVVSRAAGGFDVGDTLPLCHAHHAQQHRVGIQSFQKLHGIDLPASARMIAQMWKLAKGYPEETGKDFL